MKRKGRCTGGAFAPLQGEEGRTTAALNTHNLSGTRPVVLRVFPDRFCSFRVSPELVSAAPAETPKDADGG